MTTEETRIFGTGLLTEIDQLITSFGRLRYTALAEEEKFRLGSCKYKWEIGGDIYIKLKCQTHLIDKERLGNNAYTQSTIMGVPFEVNNDERKIIKLWREVKE